jgi:hypothetical protein
MFRQFNFPFIKLDLVLLVLLKTIPAEPHIPIEE